MSHSNNIELKVLHTPKAFSTPSAAISSSAYKQELIPALELYSSARNDNSRRYSLFDPFHLGYSKEEKHVAVTKLLGYLQRGDQHPFEENEIKALCDGHLSKIIKSTLKKSSSGVSFEDFIKQLPQNPAPGKDSVM